MVPDPPHPDPPIVVYDGECAFCRRQVERLRRRDTAARFAFVPRQAGWLDDRYPALREGDFNTGLRLIERSEAIHVGADAVYEIARRLPGYRLLAWLYRVPGLTSLLRLAYGWVARNRQRLSRATCDDGTCKT